MATQIANPNPGTKMLTSALFRLDVNGQELFFSELGGISTEVEGSEYMESQGAVTVFSRAMGRNKPPQVTLKRGFDKNFYLWEWHQEVRRGMPTAYRMATIQIFRAGASSSDAPEVSLLLENAWVSKLDLQGLSATSSSVLVENLTLLCDNIIDWMAI